MPFPVRVSAVITKGEIIMYSITLSNGEKIDGFTLKNNCLVRKEEITPAMFSGKLSPVTISGTKSDSDNEDWGNLTGTHDHMQVCYIKNTAEGYVLALGDIDNDTWEREKLRADVDFALMLGGANF